MIPVDNGQPICSGMMAGGIACGFAWHGANTGATSTKWLFECEHCHRDEAWVGEKYMNPTRVKCAHIAGTLGGDGNNGLLLDSSNDGINWNVVSNVSNINTVVVSSPQQKPTVLASNRQIGGL